MIIFDETKRQANIKKHGIDFIGCDTIWNNFTITREDKRYDYNEQRLVTFGLLNGAVVVLVYTEHGETQRIISLRKAEKYETNYYFATAKSYFS